MANDIATIFGAMAATDNGGWMIAIQSSFNATPRSAPALLSAGRPVALFGDTIFTRGGMTWNLDFTFYDALEVPSPTFLPTTVRARVRCNASGTISLGSAGSTPLVYVHQDTLDVDNLPDTLITYGAISQVDTAFWSLGTTPRYYMTDNQVEYTAQMSQHPVVAYPVDGEATVDGFVDVLRSPNRLDGTATYGVSFTITFDGTQTPTATLGSFVGAPDPATVRRYRIDLKTGVITALP